MRQFASIEAIREADVETLKNVPSMNEKAAEAVYRFFRDQRPGRKCENTVEK